MTHSPSAIAQPAVAREREAAARVDPVVLEPEVVERERPPDGEQDRVALGGRPVVEVDHVRAVRAGAGPRARSRGRRAGRRRRRGGGASATASELRGCSVGISRSPDWTIVTGTPKRA